MFVQKITDVHHEQFSNMCQGKTIETKEEHSITSNQMDNKCWELLTILCKIIQIKLMINAM